MSYSNHTPSFGERLKIENQEQSELIEDVDGARQVVQVLRREGQSRYVGSVYGKKTCASADHSVHVYVD